MLLVLLACACRGPDDPVRRLERRLLAPCCDRQTLEDHDSPVARQLRAEIEQRIARGEDPDRVEQDLVARYGPEIRAAPPARWAVVLFVIFGAGVGMLIVVRCVRRVAPPSSAGPDRERQYGEQLARELAEID